MPKTVKFMVEVTVEYPDFDDPEDGESGYFEVKSVIIDGKAQVPEDMANGKAWSILDSERSSQFLCVDYGSY